MPRKGAAPINCQHFAWRLFRRGKTHYADGRLNRPSLGKHSLGTDSHAEALVRLRELDLRMAIDRGLASETAASHATLTVEGAWAKYLDHCKRPAAMGGVAASTLARYESVRKNHLAFCRERGDGTLDRITDKHVAAFGAWLGKNGQRAATIFLSVTVVKQLVNWLVREGVLPASRKVNVQVRRSHDSDRHCFSGEQVRAMVERCRADPRLGWLADVITALATSGMRISELVDLRWTQVHLEDGMIALTDNRHSALAQGAGAVRTLKGKRGRRIPIHAALQDVLGRLPRLPDNRVFHDARCAALRPGTVRDAFVRHVVRPLTARFPTPAGEIGFGHARLHSFRHYFVSEAFRQGVSESEIRSWVGHASSRVFERYRHLAESDSRRRMAGLRLIQDGPAATKESPSEGQVA